MSSSQNNHSPRAVSMNDLFSGIPFLILHGNSARSASDDVPPPCRQCQGRAAELQVAMASHFLPMACGSELCARDHTLALFPTEEQAAPCLRLQGHWHSVLHRRCLVHAVLSQLRHRAGEQGQLDCSAQHCELLRL